MNPNLYAPAAKPTMYFIGVTTGKSSIMKVFPEWAKALNLGDCAIQGFDFVPHDQPERYREAVAFIKADPLSLGALVTTHKIDLLHACRDQFDRLDEFAAMMGEISSISKRDGRLVGHAKDPITSGLSLEAFLPANHWARSGAEALVLGAGGSAIAVTWHMMQAKFGNNRPSKIIVANRSTPRLEEIRRLHAAWNTGVAVEYVHVPRPELADALCAGLKPGSLVINATGLGKDAPGSPLTDAAVFPQDGLAWEFNYRGDLLFLRQAQAQASARDLTVEDGWVYFLHGWTRVIAEVFHVEIPTRGPRFDGLSRIAAGTRKGSMHPKVQSTETSLIEPFSVAYDLEQGLMHHAKNHLVRRASDMRGYYADAAALEKLIAEKDNPVHYEVFEVPVPEEHGHLMCCISTLQPGRVGDECFMTKGHYHSVPNTAEVYLCLRGEGYMLMKTAEGQCRAEPMSRGRMVYVPPYWAHRSINTGGDLLVSFCVYPAEAGHNYGDIAQQGFPKRVFVRAGRSVIE